MPARRLFFLDPSHLTAYHWRTGDVHEEAVFSRDEAGLAGFADYLRRHDSSLFYLLADIADESFQLEDVPYVQGNDRRELIKRKLAQFYYGTPLSLTISLGRGTEGRRDEKILFAGLTGYTHFEPWLQAMRKVEAQLVGVFSMPQLLSMWFGKLDQSAEPALVMSISRSGLRQTFFCDGQLRFSRLTPMATSGIGDLAATCSTEATKLYQYLLGQRLIARDKPLKTLILAHPAHFSIMGEHCGSKAEHQVTMVDLVAETKKLGLARTPADSRSDSLFLYLLAQRQPRQQFAPEADRRCYRLWQARSGIRAVAACFLAGCLFYAGSQAILLRGLTSDNSVLETDMVLGKRRYHAMMEGLPKVPLTPDSLRALTDRESLVARRSIGPEPLFLHISRALAGAPKIELIRLDWQIVDRQDEPAMGTGTTARPTAATPPHTATTDGGQAVVSLLAQLPQAMASDHRTQIETVNAFAASLTTSDIQVRIVSLPFETESGKSIRSGEAHTQAEPPKFALRVAQKL